MTHSRKNSDGAAAALATAKDSDDTEVALIASEEKDRVSSPPSYEVVTYPADFTLEVLVSKLASSGESVGNLKAQR